MDNTRIADGVPTLQTDWWNYGGLTRDVSVVTVPDSFVDDYDLHLSRADRKTIEGYVHVVDATPGAKVEVRIPELKVSTEAAVDADGRAAIIAHSEDLALWAPGHPKLYKVEIATGSSQDTLDRRDRLPHGRGARHQDPAQRQAHLPARHRHPRGSALPHRSGLVAEGCGHAADWAQQLGGNYVRLAHYPHDQRMTRETDRLGLLVWSEIPDYWALHFDDPAVMAKVAAAARRDDPARSRQGLRDSLVRCQ